MIMNQNEEEKETKVHEIWYPWLWTLRLHVCLWHMPYACTRSYKTLPWLKSMNEWIWSSLQMVKQLNWWSKLQTFYILNNHIFHTEPLHSHLIHNIHGFDIRIRRWVIQNTIRSFNWKIARMLQNWYLG